MEQIVIYFVSGIEIYKFKAKDSEIVASLLCLGNIAKDWLMILVLIMMLLQLMIYYTFISIY